MPALHDIARRGDDFWKSIANVNTESVLTLMILEKISDVKVEDEPEHLARIMLQCKALLELKDIEKLREKLEQNIDPSLELEASMQNY